MVCLTSKVVRHQSFIWICWNGILCSANPLHKFWMGISEIYDIFCLTWIWSRSKIVLLPFRWRNGPLVCQMQLHRSHHILSISQVEAANLGPLMKFKVPVILGHANTSCQVCKIASEHLNYGVGDFFFFPMDLNLRFWKNFPWQWYWLVEVLHRF